jgi:hypothetical protein
MGCVDPAAWRVRWESYPFAAECRDIPIGWVIEADGGAIGGSIGNVPMLYDLGGRKVKAAIATSWAVDAGHRTLAIQLITAFYRQKGVDLLLNGSANIVTAQVLTALRIPRVPIPDYARPCFWAVRPRAFARAALMRRSISGAAVLAYPAGLALGLRDILRRSGRGAISCRVDTLHGFDERFDLLWRDVTAGPPRLRAVRNRAVLEWRFGADLRKGEAVVLTAENAGKFCGYAVLARRQGSDLGMELYDVADLQAVGDSPGIVRDLLLGAIRFARQAGADAVKFTTGTPAKRAPAEALLPYSYRLPLWQLYYRTTQAELGAALSSADAWDFSLFDTF